MPQRVRYCKVDNIENEVRDLDFRAELEIEPCPAPPRQQGLALLMSLQQTPQLKGLSLQVKAPLGESTIWRPLQEEDNMVSVVQLQILLPCNSQETSNGRTKLDVLKDVPLRLS